MDDQRNQVDGIQQLHDLLHTRPHAFHLVLFFLLVQLVLHGSGGIGTVRHFGFQRMLVVFGQQLSLFVRLPGHKLGKLLRPAGGQRSGFIDDFHRSDDSLRNGLVQGQTEHQHQAAGDFHHVRKLVFVRGQQLAGSMIEVVVGHVADEADNTYTKGDDGHLRYQFHGQTVRDLESPEKIVLIHKASSLCVGYRRPDVPGSRSCGCALSGSCR